MGVMCMNLMQPRLPGSVQALFAHVVPDQLCILQGQLLQGHLIVRELDSTH